MLSEFIIMLPQIKLKILFNNNLTFRVNNFVTGTKMSFLKQKAEFKTPVNFDDLMKSGAKFEFGGNDELLDVFDESPDEDYDSDDLADEIAAKNIRINNVIGQPFEKIKLGMKKMDHEIYKQILKPGSGDLVIANAKVKVHYSVFFEGKTEPFESTFIRKRPAEIVLGQSHPIGRDLCIWTMKAGEESQFIVPYKALYGEMGVPDSIPPKADGLYIIRLLSFEDVGDAEALTEEYIEEEDTFQNVMLRVDVTRQHAKYLFKQNLFKNAKTYFVKCIRALRLSTCLSEEDEKNLKTELGQLYVNVAVCYNKLDNPKKVLEVSEDLKKLGVFEGNCKALFQHGRALAKMGEYNDALKYLDKALKLQPENNEIISAVKQVHSDEMYYKNNITEIYKKAIGNTNEKVEITEENDPLFKMIKKFSENTTVQKQLPPTLNAKDINRIKNICAQKFPNIEVKTSTSDRDTRYALNKVQ